jgi:hypothetical protein
VSEPHDETVADAVRMMVESDCLFLVVPIQRASGEFVPPAMGVRVSDGTTQDVMLTLGVASVGIDNVVIRVLAGMAHVGWENLADLKDRYVAAVDAAEKMMDECGNDADVQQYFRLRYEGGAK